MSSFELLQNKFGMSSLRINFVDGPCPPDKESGQAVFTALNIIDKSSIS
ncbi:MAG: hypothetical protein WCA84_04765 [Ignavibacteriaceae bacterium]